MAEQNKDELKNFDDLQAFPILTSDVGPTGAARPTTPGAPGAEPLGQTVDAALRDVLSWRPRAGDSQGFLAALNQAFSLKETEGRVEWQWTPRSYAVQHELGAVTGAQASIYMRARAALDQSLPLLEGLYPLRSDADLEDSDAVRAVVRSNLNELVNELGVVGGPRVQRVDTYFDSLLGPDTHAHLRDPERVSGQLGVLRDRFGMERTRVNTIEEEQNLTNFLILVDHVTSLRQTWIVQLDFFDRRGTDVFLGTQLVSLSRALSVLAESVQEAYFVMDSVFLGAAERETTQLPLEGKDKPSLTIAELLRWVERFASEEGPRMIREAGKDGVIAFRSTVDRLHHLVNAAWQISRQPTANPQRGFHTPRTQRAFQELTTHLGETLTFSDQLRRLPAPRILAVDPTSAPPRNNQRLTIDGENFQPDATIWLTQWGSGAERIDGTQITFVSSAQLRATFDLRQAESDQWAVVVKNPDGATASSPYPFLIEGQAPTQPEITDVSPRSAPNTGAVQVQIQGNNFDRSGMIARLMRQQVVVRGSGVKFEDDDTLTATFDLKGRPAGDDWSIQVENRSGGVSEPFQPFTVTLPPMITDATAAVEVVIEEEREELVAVEIIGAYFQDPATVTLIPPRGGNAIMSNETDVEVFDATHIIAFFPLSALGKQRLSNRWRVMVINDDGGRSNRHFLRTEEKPGRSEHSTTE